MHSNVDNSGIVSVARDTDAYAACRRALERIELSFPPETTVLLKPNAGRCARPGEGITTSPQVVAGVIDFLRERGARHIAVGESPITGVKTMEAFEATGIADVAREKGVKLVDLDDSRPVTVDIPDGRAIKTLKVCPFVLDADYVVSVPVMKTHMHTGVTLGLKNMKGTLWRRSKVALHQLPPHASGLKSLDVAISDLATVLLPDLTVIDGTIGMEGMGPSAGAPRRADVVVAGTDAIACDATAARLMGIDPADVVHLALAAERGCGRIEGFDVEPESYLDWAMEFEPPPDRISIEWPGIVVHQEGSCSACLSTLLVFLRKYAAEMADYTLADGNTHFAIGTGNEELPEGTVCIGNCTSPHKGIGVYVHGCPPVSSYIIEAITGRRVGEER